MAHTCRIIVALLVLLCLVANGEHSQIPAQTLVQPSISSASEQYTNSFTAVSSAGFIIADVGQTTPVPPSRTTPTKQKHIGIGHKKLVFGILIAAAVVLVVVYATHKD